MEDIEKIYKPEVIEDTPFPQSDTQDLTTTSSEKGGEVLKPDAIKDNPFPVKRVAVEVIGVALNTRSKKILQEFQFTEFGALQIGKYQNGVNGDIRISPIGIVARNKAGETTIGVDGETGDAIFAGTIRAGSTIVSDTIITEKASNGNGRTVYLNDGVPAIVIGDPS